MYKAFIILTLMLTALSTESGVFDRVEEEIDCLAQNIYYEARGEPTKGKLAVAHVTMNRVSSPQFPNSVCAVVTQKYKKTCQFSWFCMPNIPKIKQDVYADIRKMAERVYFKESKDPTKGATHFHAISILPSWAETKRVTAAFGNHIFYRK